MKIKIIKDEVRNLDITHLRNISLNSHDWHESGVSEYRLYAYLSTKFNDSIILDIGTHRGVSALSLSYNERNKIRSYDILEQGASTIKKDNISWHIGQFTEDSEIDWDNVSIVMLDVGWHTGNEEREMIQQQAMQMAQAQAMQMQGGQGGPPGSPPLEEPASAVANEVGV